MGGHAGQRGAPRRFGFAARFSQLLEWGASLRSTPATVLAIVSAGVAFPLAVQRLVLPEPEIAPYVLLFTSVATVALIAGVWPALVTVVLLGIAANYLFVEPYYAWSLSTAAVRSFFLFSSSAVVVAVLCAASRGVTRRLKEVSQALSTQSELLRLAHDAVLVVRPQRGIEMWNHGAEELYGFTEDEALGQDPVTFLRARPDDDAPFADHLDGRAWSGELHRRTKDGRGVIVQVRLQRIRGSDGVERILETARDVTERKLAERERERLMKRLERSAREARQGRAQIETMFQAIGDGVMVFDSAGHIQLINDAARRLMNLAGVADVGQEIARFAELYDVRTISGEPLPFEQWPAPRVMRGETLVDEEIVVRRHDERQGWRASFSGAPVRDEDGRVTYAVVVLRDVTEQKRAVEALRASERRFRELANAMPQLVWTAEPDGTVDYYNDQRMQLAGIERDGERWSWRPVLHSDDAARTLAAWERAVRTGEAYEISHRVQVANGEYRWHLSRGVPVRNAEGRIVKWYGTATDIHDQKLAEDALRAADQRKDDFLAMLGHELRNPLTPIRNGLYLLERVPPGSDQARRAQEIIERQVTHMTRLVDDLLDVARISRGKIQLQKETVDLDQIARSVVEDHASTFRARGVELELASSLRPVWVEGDRTRLEQVLGNLLQNAAKFTPSGGRTVVTVEADPKSARAALRVRDNGSGIAPEMLPRLFRPFMQAESTLARSRGGLGLGLALIKGLVELHDGTVEVASEGVDEGAEFIVRLPLAPAAIEGVKLVGDAARGTAHRVLVIEDNVDAAETLKAALELGDHEVEVAGDGAEGLELARRFSPDAVVCDIGLPGADGYQVARWIRSDPELRSVKLIALSGYAQPEDIARSRAAGFDAHVAKPPDLRALEEVLAERPPARTGT